MLKEVQVFRQSELIKLFQKDFELSKDAFVNIITGLAPENIKDFIAREQAVGSLSTLKETADWFEGMEETLTKLISDNSN